MWIGEANYARVFVVEIIGSGVVEREAELIGVGKGMGRRLIKRVVLAGFAWDVIGVVGLQREESGEGVEGLVGEMDEAFEGRECGGQVGDGRRWRWRWRRGWRVLRVRVKGVWRKERERWVGIWATRRRVHGFNSEREREREH